MCPHSLVTTMPTLYGRYKDGHDHICEHRDDERELDPACPIASVSLGAARDFVFRHRDSRGQQPRRRIEPVKLQLAHGSLLLMNQPTNTHWYHSVPPRKRVLTPRINLTFRRIVAENAQLPHGLADKHCISKVHPTLGHPNTHITS